MCSRPLTEADPVVTRVALGRSNDGTQFGMFLQIYADGTVIDSEGVHHLGREAIRESLLDEAEGADILLIKPGLPYLDVLARLRERTLLPLAAYQVSGEYAMIKFAAAAGAVDERRAVRETLGAFKRAGADLILSYFAADVIREGW